MSEIKKILMGNVCDNSHPIHPATVHLPIAFLLTASTLDILHLATLHAPILLDCLTSATGTTAVPLLYQISQISYFATIAGILTAVPAVATGATELFSMIQKRGLDSPITRLTLMHAGLMDLSVAGAAYNWLSRRQREGVLANTANGLVSVAMVALTGFAAYLGGTLVYNHGVGVQRMGRGLREKQQGAVQETKSAVSGTRKEL